MGETIEVDDQVWSLLRTNAEPFVDTPNSVLRRLLGLESQLKESDHAAPGPRREARAADLAHKKARRKRAKPQGGRTRVRAPSGSLLPEDSYEVPLLRALENAGGRAPYREVVEAVGEELRSQLKPLDLEPLSSGTVRWESRLQFVRLRLIERGLLARDTPRGVWGISDAGREALRTGVTK